MATFSRETELSPEQQSQKDLLLQKLPAELQTRVNGVIGIVDILAQDYLIEIDPLGDLRTPQADYNAWAFERTSWNDDRTGYKQETGYPFFSVYAIGGTVTKEGPRPDLDLMVVSNAWWIDRNEGEYLEELLTKEFGDTATIKIQGDLPDNYNLGKTEGKSVITITPNDGSTPIDIVYVRGIPGDRSDEKEAALRFITREKFEARVDVDANGEQLPRVLLYSSARHDLDRRW